MTSGFKDIERRLTVVVDAEIETRLRGDIGEPHRSRSVGARSQHASSCWRLLAAPDHAHRERQSHTCPQ